MTSPLLLDPHLEEDDVHVLAVILDVTLIPEAGIVLAMSKKKLDFTPIAQLNPVSENEIWKIKVRVARMWRFQNSDKPGDVGGIDLILVDDKVCDLTKNVIGEVVGPCDLKEISVRKFTIQSGKSSTKLFINSDIAEINESKEKMPKDVISTTSAGSTLSLSYSSTQVTSNHIPFDNRLTISQLLTSYEFNRENEYPRELLALEGREFVFTVNKPETSKNFTPSTFKVNDVFEESNNSISASIESTSTPTKKRPSTLAIEDCVPQDSSKKLKGDVPLLAEEDGQFSSTKSKPKVGQVTKNDCTKPSSTKERKTATLIPKKEKK
ncbi:unnamed protein product [Eruca vesicaria subsp. sativa]|uniref:DUF223 domain-containing protein n=1 Tax=Eruca vesicaria subsp. sativa TaxID=29727 RepID=A0ABC8J5M3_ERUVS|nr:unnamed protein product [Eruca vesicaria subsp. sativa]